MNDALNQFNKAARNAEKDDDEIEKKKLEVEETLGPKSEDGEPPVDSWIVDPDPSPLMGSINELNDHYRKVELELECLLKALLFEGVDTVARVTTKAIEIRDEATK